MTRRHQDEISVFSTSFLDLLSCGMGAVIILLIIFLSRIEVVSNDSTSFAMVTISVEYAHPDLIGPLDERLSVGAREVIRPSASGHLELVDKNNVGHSLLPTASFTATYDTIASASECIVSASAQRPPINPATFSLRYVLAPSGMVPISATKSFDLTYRRTYTLILKHLQDDEKIRLKVKRRPFPPVTRVPKALAFQSLDRLAGNIGSALQVPGLTIPPRPYPTGDGWITAVMEGGRVATNFPARISCQIHSSAAKAINSPGAPSLVPGLNAEEILNDSALTNSAELLLEISINQDLALLNPVSLSGS